MSKDTNLMNDCAQSPAPCSVPLPPTNAEVITTVCDYCIVGCGYKVYRWPTTMTQGSTQAATNALGLDFPVTPLSTWVSPNMHTIVKHNGTAHHVLVLPDREAKVVNVGGDHSILGGTLAQKCYREDGPTKDRLKTPLLRVNGTLQPISWELALDIAASIGRYVIDQHGAQAYGIKSYSYQYFENTYAISKFAFRHLQTPNFTFHDTPADVTSTPGFRDAGFDNFAACYEDWRDAETLLICGTDPFETKNTIFTQWIMPGIRNGQKTIFMLPRKTAGVAFAEDNGGLWLDVTPGTDLLVINAIARLIVENQWQDKEWIKNWVNTKWESTSGFGQGTRNTPWQWRTTWGKFQTDGFEDWTQWLLDQPEFSLENAAKVSRVAPEKIVQAARLMAAPRANGNRPKTSIMIEKGLYWSNNTGNTNAISALGIIVGAGGRPGQVIGRGGGHQRGGVRGGKYPRNMSPEKLPGRRRRALDTDRYFISGHTRLAHVIGTTWLQAMSGTYQLRDRFEQLVHNNPHQITSTDRDAVIDTLKRRADSGGTVVINQDIYLIDPIGARYADLILPAATWGESPFMRANGERRIRLYDQFYDAPGEAKPDWWIIAGIATRMGFEGFDWQDASEVAEEAARFTRGSRKDFYPIKIVADKEGKSLHDKMREFGTEGIQGPVMLQDDGQLIGTKRLHDINRKLPDSGPAGVNRFTKKLTAFNSQTGKLNLQKSPWSLFSDYWEWLSPQKDELWLTSGRLKERWQSGFDDKRKPYLNRRLPENIVEIHPDDASTRGIESGDYVEVFSDRVPGHKHTLLGIEADDFRFSKLMENGHIELTSAKVRAVAHVTPQIKQGVLYMDFLRYDAPANALSGRIQDWISGNYNYKMSVARVHRIGESPYKHSFEHFSFARRDLA
ncbi:arsenate reductase (azurin) large subunit [Aestuariirhabdus sp. Z084]|uniref:arsenate reductase (azurin) large subunit n=1 Tax=Aestuariirhabdus haliotis TaxID=2918751 RepID=UPI00201B462C|nr:arsenate reductase (azurin) large subunit [Aestuariirhabdus haliotis]MCL6415172.1 arsenate reductase (azurin) large subunit [Aestuariirhabdus haliotis]MCL6420047.1 arsenate reductase (azurin) large subunit [Aestuariirhabdus haliotis]